MALKVPEYLVMQSHLTSHHESKMGQIFFHAIYLLKLPPTGIAGTILHNSITAHVNYNNHQRT